MKGNRTIARKLHWRLFLTVVCVVTFGGLLPLGLSKKSTRMLRLHETTTADTDMAVSMAIQQSAYHHHHNPRQVLPDRLAEAVFVAASLKHTESYVQLVCPTEQELGKRLERQPPINVGTACEPWQNREILQVLWQTLDSSMVGLEWSSGSGTSWLLRRGVTMHSVEHCEPWLDDLKGKLESVIADKQGTKWYPHHVPRSDGLGCSQDRGGSYATALKKFGDYVRYPREHLMKEYAPNGFDIVEIDGRFRDGCMVEAAALDGQPSMLVKPDYGILLLDNSQRDRYVKQSELPSHWLVVSFQSENFGETTIWMTCPTKEDEPCARARARIADLMANLPIEHIGRRYTEHMERARVDKVPGARGREDFPDQTRNI